MSKDDMRADREERSGGSGNAGRAAILALGAAAIAGGVLYANRERQSSPSGPNDAPTRTRKSSQGRSVCNGTNRHDR